MIVIVAPVISQPDPQPQAPPPRLAATWTSWAGDVWTITDPASPVFAVAGATGLRGAEVEHWWSDSPTIHGSTWDGHRIARGELFMPIRIDGPDVDSYLATEAAFMRSLDPRRESVLRVTRPDGEWRENSLRYLSGMDIPIEPDPVMVRRATYGVTWATADPFWHGDPIALTFRYSVVSPFFPGPPFIINETENLSTASSSNPGEVDSYAVWRVNGPFTSFTVGVPDHVDDGGLIALTLTKGPGEWVEIDTNPHQRTIIDNEGRDQWAAATAADFVGIPPGDVGLVTSVGGAADGTSVELSFTPRYRSAW